MSPRLVKFKKRFRVEITNGNELRDKIRRAGADVIGVLPVAVKMGAENVAKQANQWAPGPHVVVEPSKPWSMNSIAFDIGPDRGHWYYKFFESGVVPVEVNMVTRMVYGSAKGDRKLRKSATKKAVVVYGHPWAKVIRNRMHARPFLRPALLNDQQKTAEEVGRLFERALDALLASR